MSIPRSTVIVATQGVPGRGVKPWEVVTAARQAFAGDRLQCDTSGGAFTVTLPANPAEGAEVFIYKSGAADLTLARNGETIGGLAEDLVVDLDGVELDLIFRNDTWRY